MDDDFNTREGVTVLHEIAGDINRLDDKSSEHAACLARTLIRLGDVLGIMQMPPAEFLHAGRRQTADISTEEITRLIRRTGTGEGG